jgi:predicted permease
VSWLTGARVRLRLLLWRRGVEDRMDEEFRFHVEMETEKNLRAGLSRREARRRALVAFGGVAGHREAMRDGRGVRWLEDLVQDLRFALRSLARRPGFTAVAVTTMAVGVGATTLVFTLVNATLLRPLPVPEPDRLFGIAESRTGAVWQGMEGGGVPYGRYVAYREATEPVFSGLAAHRSTPLSLRAGEEAVAVQGVLASGNYFTVAGVRPAAGRFFTADDERAVVVAHHVWRDRFSGDPDVAGRIVHIDSRPYTVAGVAPRGFTGMAPAVAADVWVPIAVARADGLGSMASWVAMFGRLRPGQDAASADALVNVVATSVPPDEPQTTVRGAALDPMTGMLRGQARTMARTALTLLLGTAFLVLLIASLNTAGMLVARGIARRRELAVRVTLGAGRGRLVRQLLAESGLLAILGGTGGVLLALVGTRLVAATPVPFFATLIGLDLRLDLRVLAFALVLTATTALLFGFLPALHASRPALARALKEGGSGAATARAPARSVFVSAQLAMAVFLIIVAGHFAQSFQRTLETGLGYDHEGVVIATTSLDPHGYDGDRGRAFQQSLVERVRSIPGTESVALARAPLLGGSPHNNDMVAPGDGGEDRRDWGVAQNRVDPDFFSLLRLPIVAGRGFTVADGAAGADGGALTVVNETLARRLWPDRNPLGERVTSHGGEYVVVGVVRDGRYSFRSGFPAGYAFFPATQQYNGTTTLHVRSTLEPAELIRRIREEVRALDPNVAVENPQPLSIPVGRIHAPQRAATTILALFGGVGLLLAGIGVYGVLAFQVAQRSRELGVRIALGAPARAVVRLVVGRGALIGVAGVAAGLASGAAVSIALRRFLFGVAPGDPVTFGLAALLLLFAFLLGCLVPVVRALRVDPIHVLRAE